MAQRCYWPKIHHDTKEYVQACEVCQQIKPPAFYNQAELVPLRPNRPFEIMTTDIDGELPLSEAGNCYILVVCDHFTKWVELFALRSITAQDVAEKLMLVCCRHGMPETILSDQGTNYQAALISELLELLDVRRVRTSPYHPECDGLTERFNRTLKTMIASYVNEDQDDWDTKLPMLAFAYNTAVHATTKCTPFELIYGREPKIPLDLTHERVEVDLFLPLDKDGQRWTK